MNGLMIDSPFFAEVKAAFEDLLARGALRIRSSAYDEQAFGNAEVVLEGRHLLIRLVRDRGDVFADVRPLGASERWRPLERTLQAVGVTCIRSEGLLSVVEAARLAEGHFDALDIGLSPGRIPETILRLERLNAEAAKKAEERWTTHPSPEKQTTN